MIFQLWIKTYCEVIAIKLNIASIWTVINSLGGRILISQLAAFHLAGQHNSYFHGGFKYQRSIDLLISRKCSILTPPKNIWFSGVFREGRNATLWNGLAIFLASFPSVNPSNANPTKWSNILKQFVGCCRRIFWLCLTILWDWHVKCEVNTEFLVLHKRHNVSGIYPLRFHDIELLKISYSISCVLT